MRAVGEGLPSTAYHNLLNAVKMQQAIQGRTRRLPHASAARQGVECRMCEKRGGALGGSLIGMWAKVMQDCVNASVCLVDAFEVFNQ